MMLTSIEQLEALYGLPHERAVRKQIPFLNEDYQAMVRASPLVVIGSAGPDGLDSSPRGDVPGFVQVLDERTLALPDRPGNNRIDTLRNVLHDPRVSLLFLIPGIGETLRSTVLPGSAPNPHCWSVLPSMASRLAPYCWWRSKRRFSIVPKPWCAQTCGTRIATSSARPYPAPGRSTSA